MEDRAAESPADDVSQRRRAEREAQALYQAALAIGSERDLDARLERVLDAALNLAHADRAEVTLSDPARRELQLVAARGREPRHVGERRPFGTGLTGAVLMSERLLRVKDALADERTWAPARARQAAIRGWLGVPLMSANGPSGVLAVMSEQPDAFDADDERHLQALAALAESALREARLLRQMQEEIAERVRVEEALRQSGQHLAEAQRIAHLGSWEHDLSGDRVMWSDGLYRIFGLELQAFEPTPTSILEWVHPDDKARMNVRWDRHHREPGPFENVYRIIHPDGTHRVVHERGEAYADQQGRLMRTAGTVQDVTEWKEAEQALYRREQEFKAIVESTPDSITRWNREMRCVYANQAVERAIGLPASAMIGRTRREFGRPESPVGQHVPVWELTLQQVLASGREQSIEIVTQLPMGERIYHVRLAPEFGADGAVAFVLALARDVTEHRRREEDQARLYRELLDREEQLNALVRRALVSRGNEQQRLRSAGELEDLTRREREILTLLARGRTNKQIGRELGLAPGTVRNHIGRLLPKLGAADRTQAAVRAIELELGSPTPR